jgi:hypothetical protein
MTRLRTRLRRGMRSTNATFLLVLMLGIGRLKSERELERS